MAHDKPPDESEPIREALRHVREDREQIVAGLEAETGWMRDSRLKRIAELDAVIEKLRKRIAEH